MKSPLLRKLAKRKIGWRPEAIMDDSGKPNRYACMVTNGVIAKLVDSGTKLDSVADQILEKKVIDLINELNKRDEEIIKRDSIIFSVLASATIGQAQSWVGLIHQKGKANLNTMINHIEKVVNDIQKDAIDMGGEQMEIMLDALEDATHRVFQQLGTAIDEGRIPEFLQHVESFNKSKDEESEK